MVKHVLSDGTEVSSVEGRVIREHEARAVYLILEKINQRRGEKIRHGNV